jgi:hypothetical protein
LFCKSYVDAAQILPAVKNIKSVRVGVRGAFDLAFLLCVIVIFLYFSTENLFLSAVDFSKSGVEKGGLKKYQKNSQKSFQNSLTSLFLYDILILEYYRSFVS